jgi:hypothetical protein
MADALDEGSIKNQADGTLDPRGHRAAVPTVAAMRLKTRLRLVVSTLALTAVVTGCTGPAPTDQSSQSLTSVDSFADLGARELIDQLERTPVSERPEDLIASIRHDEVLLSRMDGTDEVSVPIAEGHYLSIAPYVNQTHECYFHSLTTCTAEMGGQPIDVRIVDAETGGVLVDETTEPHDNGFVGYWLPRDITATVSVAADGLTGEATVSTGAEDLTCLSSLQLT